jgi:hypothetical protein
VKVLPSLMIATWVLSCDGPAPRLVPTVPIAVSAAPSCPSMPPPPAPTAALDAALDAAADAPGPAAVQETPPPRPEEPSTPGRSCEKDDDCEIVPDDCTACAPCEAVWRRAASHASVRSLLERRRRVPCPPISCPDCPPPPPSPPGLPLSRPARGYLGSRAACVRGQCVVVE